MHAKMHGAHHGVVVWHASQVYGLMERYQTRDSAARNILQRAQAVFGPEYDFWGAGYRNSHLSGLEVDTD